jgi:hypothetical protein
MPYPVYPQFGLAGQANRFMSQQAALPYNMNLPGYGSMVGQRSQNIGGLLRGQVPQDVQRNLLQAGAERGVGMGSPGSPNANAAWLRSLGLTSLGLQESGGKQLGEAIQQTPVPELWNPMELYMNQLKSQEELEAAKAGRGGRGGGGWGGGGGVSSMPGFYGGDYYKITPRMA